MIFHRILYTLLCVFFAVLLMLSGSTRAWADASAKEPLLHWQNDKKPTIRGGFKLEIQSAWQASMIKTQALNSFEIISPDEIWKLPNSAFTGAVPPGAVPYRSNERFVARLSIQTEKDTSALVLSLLQPRLDAVHVSYRYANTPWKTLSSGDTIAMNRWAQPDTQPSFSLEAQAGRMDIVLQIAQRGSISVVSRLQDQRAYLQERAFNAWINGLLVSMCLLTAIVGILSAVNHQRSSFLSVSLTGLLMAALLFFNSGEGGTFLFTDSDRFNDQVKLMVNWIWSTSLPLATVLALNLNKRSPRPWWICIAIALVGALIAPWLAQYEQRELSFRLILITVSTLFIFSLLLLAWIFWRGWWGNPYLFGGLTLMLILPIIRFFIFARQWSSFNIDQITAFAGVVACILMMRGLFLYYKHGKHVIAQSKLSPLRDPLTGLLNREGLQSSLKKMQANHAKLPRTALWMYLQFDSQHLAEQTYGEEGVDTGLVQIGANLSTHLSNAEYLARVSRSAFAVVITQAVDEALAARTAQKILSNLLILSEHGSPLAARPRIALAWIPLYGYDLQTLRARSRHVLANLPERKHLAWLGGAGSHALAHKSLEDMRHGLPVQAPDDASTLADVPSTPAYNSGASSSLLPTRSQ